ncbi:UDP-glucose--hexose-1-phosphate uridylyltransferase [Breznakia pachnodae]|uniref:Galactose-1-phosphate uridylyltransferase n=1 Tax=Breznakia pachnodae TaxID=265178 RepID=A0ABU0E4R9_9FIRM|nr:UDP-glucose--hexose-1-phosphate uridylyltransferase [Breznakia pachnodae]MDQ0361714.1 UDPglucose--hexose-1-phosphate uridylyltransferase [Breznakia pachnodae]
MNKYIDAFIDYGLQHHLIHKEDEIYTRNRMLEILDYQEYEPSNLKESYDLSQILDELYSSMIKRGLLEEGNKHKERWESLLVDLLVPKPSMVIHKFGELYKENPRTATDYYYHLAMDSNYIQRDRLHLDKKWKVETEYGVLDITINLAKPEKDPKDIAAAKQAKSSGYPKCVLCRENEGYAGNMNHPARSQHRLIPLSLRGETYYLQYSPYVYYNEHCIILNGEHKPMQVDKNLFIALFDFVDIFPHYFVGSNADLPIVGGSILSHDHFQGGNYTFAMAEAKTSKPVISAKFPEVEYSRVFWPLSVIRLNSSNREKLINCASHILALWRNYSDKEAGILAYTKEPHNTITPIVRKKEHVYEMDLVLRNNRTSEEYPDGIFHPHKEWHMIKKENIGLIEVMGLAILPPRLLREMEELKKLWIHNETDLTHEDMNKYQKWYNDLRLNYPNITEDIIDDVLQKEIGMVFLHVLEDAGVYKQTQEGQKQFQKFLDRIEGD